MYKVCSRKKWLSLILCFFLIFSLVVSLVPGIAIADDGSQESASPYEKIITDESGRQITQAIFPLPPPKTKVAVATVPKVHIAGAVNTLSNVPAFDWSYGCSATSAAMLFGYYDRIGYSNMYTGPANGGVCPLNNSVWGHTVWPSITCGESPINATHNGFDGRAIRGHVDDYWTDYESSGDPYVGNWTEHTLDCAGDYMGTNQWKYGSPVAYNTDGSTVFFWETNGDPLYDYTEQEPTYRDGCHGMRLFAESRGYTVVTNFSQLIQGQGSDPSKGFTFANFQAEIDAGRPVLIQLEGHTMLGYGYNTSGNIIYMHDTWDYSDHEMIWGDTYEGLQHRAVTVIRLQAAPAAKLVGADDSTATPIGTACNTLCRFQAGTTGTITEFKIKCTAAGQAKVAIYADDSGSPGARLAYNNTAQDTVVGWNTLSIPSLAITSSSYYWLAVANNTNGVACYNSAVAGTVKYNSPIAFSTFSFPDSAGSFSFSWNKEMLFAGWGTTSVTPLSITTTSLPNGTIGVSYSQTVQASGGSGSYSWSITVGSLPAGLGPINSSTGVISGTPTTAGTSNFTVQVSDGSTTATQALSYRSSSVPMIALLPL